LAAQCLLVLLDPLSKHGDESPCCLIAGEELFTPHPAFTQIIAHFYLYFCFQPNFYAKVRGLLQLFTFVQIPLAMNSVFLRSKRLIQPP